MLGTFVKPTKDHKERQYKTAMLKLPDGSEKSFKYYKLDNSEVQQINFISQLNFEAKQLIIRTTSTLPFNIRSKIIIDGIQYTINLLYSIEQETNNGPFISRNIVVFKYLQLIH